MGSTVCQQPGDLHETAMKDKYKWLEKARGTLDEARPEQSYENISWSAFHASCLPSKDTPTALLPLFHQNAHTVVMIRHSEHVVRCAVKQLNTEQIPVIGFDQSLFVIAKKIQWKWLAEYREEHFIILFGRLHIEMAILTTLGDWLRVSGWTQALLQAEVAVSGTADSFLNASLIGKTRRPHQITVAALYSLQHKVCEDYRQTLPETAEIV